MKESDIQRAVFDNIKRRGAPNVFAFAIPNNRESRRTVGFKPGMQDVGIVKDGIFYGLELKVEKGAASVDQLVCRDGVNNAGGYACICHGLDRALATLETWGILRKAA